MKQLIQTMTSDEVKIKYLATPKKETILWLSFLLFLIIPGIGVIDFLTGPAITFALIYLLPVSAIAWLNNRPAIVLASILTAITWIGVDFFSDRFPLSMVAYIWNFFSRLIILLVISILFSALKKTLLYAQDLSHSDPLTNALNSRGFKELAEHELQRSTRSEQPLTIAFLDVDNFKTINDTLGHNTGDLLLIKIVESIGVAVRKSDVVARIGGDEFVILLPETGQEAAKITINKMQEILLTVSKKNNWPVTYSIGVLTCIEMPPTVDAMIGMADKLMYTVKTSTKNNMAFSVYPEEL